MGLLEMGMRRASRTFGGAVQGAADIAQALKGAASGVVDNISMHGLGNILGIGTKEAGYRVGQLATGVKEGGADFVSGVKGGLKHQPGKPAPLMITHQPELAQWHMSGHNPPNRLLSERLNLANANEEAIATARGQAARRTEALRKQATTDERRARAEGVRPRVANGTNGSRPDSRRSSGPPISDDLKSRFSSAPGLRPSGKRPAQASGSFRPTASERIKTRAQGVADFNNRGVGAKAKDAASAAKTTAVNFGKGVLDGTFSPEMASRLRWNMALGGLAGAGGSMVQTAASIVAPNNFGDDGPGLMKSAALGMIGGAALSAFHPIGKGMQSAFTASSHPRLNEFASKTVNFSHNKTMQGALIMAAGGYGASGSKNLTNPINSNR